VESDRGVAAAPPERAAGRAPSVALTLAGVLLVAVNLRAAIAALAPLLSDVRADLHIDRGTAGLLTTVPVLCFGLLSPFAVLLGRRIGSERALLLAVLGIAAGSAVRLLPSLGWMFAGTAVIGAGITVGNVLVPTVVKRDFGHRSGTVTGLYTAAMTAGAATAAAISAPIADHTGGGWRVALLVWAAPALLAAAVWLPQLSRRHLPPPRSDRARGQVRRSSITWALVLFMALQSLTFYAVLAWLPALLADHGASLGGAGLALSLFNLLGIPTSLAVPVLAARRRDQRPVAVAICVGWLVMVLGLLVAPRLYLLWSVLGGLAQGGGIGLLLILIVLRASGPDVARTLSGTVQTIGYLVGSSGPFLLGALRDATGTWTASLLLLVAAVVVMSAGAVWAARDRQVG
jgi:CP family cyanate transporter-like MFS transporter